MKKINIIILLATISISASSYGQDTLSISKVNLWQKVADKNLQIKIADQEFKSAQADYRQSNSLFLPSITASHTAIATNNPLMAFGSKLNQATITSSDFNPEILNNPDRTTNFATKIEVLQPIINVDGLYGRQAARAKMNAFELRTERTKEYLELEVNKSFMELQLAYKAVGVLEKASATAEANLELIGNYFKQGILQKTDLLSVQVRVNEIKNQLQYAKSNVQNASDYLAFILNEDLTGSVYKPVEGLENIITLQPINTSLPANRKDIQAMAESTEAYQKMLQSSKMTFLPRLNAFGSYELYDDTLFGTNAKGYVVGAQLLWNVFDGYKSIGKMEKAKADFQKAEIEIQQYKAKSQLELNKANRQLSDAENKVSLSKLDLEQSQEAYRIRSNRFSQGLEKTTDLLESETQMFKKELEYLQAVFEYNYTQEYLKFLTK